MSRRTLNRKGFTLIEILVSLLLVGIVTAVIGLSSYHMVNGFVFARKNSDTLLKGQIAIARMTKELNNVKTVYVASTNGMQITFTSYKDGGTVSHTISWAGGAANLLLDGIALTDQIGGFSLAYYDSYSGTAQTTWSATSRIIEINLVLTGAENTPAAFNARVAPSFDVSLVSP